MRSAAPAKISPERLRGANPEAVVDCRSLDAWAAALQRSPARSKLSDRVAPLARVLHGRAETGAFAQPLAHMAKDGHGQLLYLIHGSSIGAVETFNANQRMHVHDALWRV